MAKKLEFWGILGTVVYLVIITATVAFKFEKFLALELNELGDFLAGAFGPIAFLWLVLGFLQQGRELKLSSDALHLQAEELKNSVAQQTKMADAAMQQIESQRISLEFQRREFERSIAPVLRFETRERAGGQVGMPIRLATKLLNTGQEVSDALIVLDPAIGGNNQFIIPRIGIKSSHDIAFNLDWPDEDLSGSCSISYMRSDGKRIVEEFAYKVSADNPFVLIERVAPTPQAD
ncbi:hypothetical protein PS943_01465 [Pseudomonas fluorescens]|uniref:Uncharacterized protein n=1 Tax=Pseudomonas fluorescens TaxID=294 RepID=A0A5E7W455_PSEFL|nr:hypothetical protein [Pseudomonas fluorescens]VVQ29736.1 hypothetical protein PS943_01465 [Pseudomonas fluorescens]